MLGSVAIQSLWTGQCLGHTVVIWFFPISPVFQAGTRPDKSRRGAQVL